MEYEFDFKYRGKTLSELQAMPLKDFAKLTNARARRNLLRNESDPFYQKFEKGVTTTKSIRTHKRDIVITPKMVGAVINVYNGKDFLPVTVVAEMLGHYLGEFALTRKRIRHGKAGIGATKSSTAISKRK